MTPRRPILLCVCALLALLAGGGCDEKTPAPGAGGAPGAGPVAPAAEAAWTPDPSDVLLLLSGREEGLLKPCGCSSPQRGGLERRGALHDLVRPTAKASAAVSLGDGLSTGEPTQNGFKADLLRASWAAMGYAGAVLSASDLSPFSTSLSQPHDAPETTPRPPLNVKVKGSGLLAASAGVDPILRLRVGDLPVRVVSVVDATTQPLLVDQWGVADIVVPPDAALRALPKEPGLLVVAAHVMREDVALVGAAATAAADLAVVVDVPGQVALRTPVRGRGFDRALLVTFDGLGKEVGVLRLHRGASGWTASYDAVPLDPVYATTPSPTREVVASLFADYRRRVREAGLLASFPTFPDDGPSFVGAAACQACHPAIYEEWEQTAHAQAMDTLAAKNDAWDPECVRCHSVGWSRDLGGQWSRSASGFRTPDATPGLSGVQCEHCHGAGSAHVKEPERKDLFGPRGTPGKMWKTPGRAGCEVCHDVENSHGFHRPGAYEGVYLPKVDHRDVPADRRTVGR